MGVLINAWRRFQHRGFVGPKYRGLWGKVRLLWQGWFGHEEIVSCAEPDSWTRPGRANPGVSLIVADTFQEVGPYLPALREAYGRDFTASWRGHLESGQTAALALLEGRLAAFVWIQHGSRGATAPYTALLPGEFRLVRGGVLPAFRGQSVHTTRHILVLEYLFSIGARRVYIDAFADNVFSWKGQHKAGYREIGRIWVRGSFTGKTFVRWMRRRDHRGADIG